MMELFARELGGAASWHLAGGVVDVEGVLRACAEARQGQEPALVLGTSFAFVHLLDAAGASELELPAGSRAMQTGGFKGRSREVAAPELRGAIAARFAVPERHIVAEYGMTELSSQLYEGTLAHPSDAEHGVYLAPPWLRVVAVDPSSLAPLPDGEVGIARIVDLANVDSAVAVQTADRVRVLPGRGVEAGRVELLGRAPGATPRGCSIAIDELLG
jgi:acyl-CoA synthetase (AMP-forming)/AMP-acid ligase II